MSATMMTPMRDAEVKNYDGYMLPDTQIDGYFITTRNRPEENARKAAAKDGSIAFILRWQSEVGNNVYGLCVTEEIYQARRTAKKLTR